MTHYVVEKRETSRVVWSMVSEKQEECNVTTTKVIKGNEYVFRIRAVNKFGVGDPLESDSVIAKNRFGKIDVNNVYSGTSLRMYLLIDYVGLM